MSRMRENEEWLREILMARPADIVREGVVLVGSGLNVQPLIHTGTSDGQQGEGHSGTVGTPEYLREFAQILLAIADKFDAEEYTLEHGTFGKLTWPDEK